MLAGSLLQVENYQLVVERFLQTDFPSWEQLANLEHVREKKTRQVPLFSGQLKSSLCSSMAILDYGKAAYQHSISVPKQLPLLFAGKETFISNKPTMSILFRIYPAW